MISRPLILAICLMFIVSCARKPDATNKQGLPTVTTLPPPVLSPSDQPVIVIYVRNITNNPTYAGPPYSLDTAVWSDGRIVWRVGDSHLEGKIDIKKIDELLQRLHREGVFGYGKGYYGERMPDAGYTAIKVRLADRELKLYSWNDGSEPNSQTVYTSQGMESLEGRDRDAVMTTQPPEWKRFRGVWSDIRSTVRSWVPSEGKPFVGSIPTDSGN